VDDDLRSALEDDTRVDITTTGRKTGEARRVSIALHHLDGRLFVVGPPGRRSWYANVVASSAITIHLTQSLGRDVPALGTPVTDAASRRQVFSRMQELEERVRERNMEEWIEGSPLVEIEPQT
jgi:deazaflavin-dependent oxidoreductase (nitroreductase family)